MSLLQWSDKLDVHVDGMNQEHAELIRLMNSVYDVNSRSEGKANVTKALQELVAYVAVHFAHEEAYMESIGFGGLRKHKYIHKDLLDRVSGYVEDYRNAQSDSLPRSFFEFLKFWLVSHIQGIDTKYSSPTS